MTTIALVACGMIVFFVFLLCWFALLAYIGPVRGRKRNKEYELHAVHDLIMRSDGDDQPL